MKKKWEKPQLIVLVKSNQDEAVLQACKANVGGGTGSPPTRLCQGAARCSASGS